MDPLTLMILSSFNIISGTLIAAFNHEKYSLIVGTNLISTGLLGIFIAASI